VPRLLDEIDATLSERVKILLEQRFTPDEFLRVIVGEWNGGATIAELGCLLLAFGDNFTLTDLVRAGRAASEDPDVGPFLRHLNVTLMPNQGCSKASDAVAALEKGTDLFRAICRELGRNLPKG